MRCSSTSQLILYGTASFAFYLFLMGIGRYIPSSELVPGDVYEVTDHALTQFPCDSILLAGDCIVNESMLTGKFSIPADIYKFLFSQANLFQSQRYQQLMSLCTISTLQPHPLHQR